MACRKGIRFLEFLGDAAGSRRSPPSIEAGVLRTQRARVTNLKDFVKPPFVPRTQSSAHLSQTSLFEHSLRQDEDVQNFVAAQGLPLLPSLENLSAPALSSLERCSSSHYLHFAFLPSSSCDLFPAFFIFSPPRAAGGPILARGRPATVSSREDEQGRSEDSQSGGKRKIVNAQVRGK